MGRQLVDSLLIFFNFFFRKKIKRNYKICETVYTPLQKMPKNLDEYWIFSW